MRRGALWRAVAVASAAVLLWHAPGQLRQLRSDVEAGARDRRYRQLQPARTVGLGDLRPFLAAEAVVPPDGRFAVVVARGPAATPAARSWARPFARYWLLPRRLASTPAGAEWVLSYGADPEELQVDVRRVEVVARGVVLAEVARR